MRPAGAGIGIDLVNVAINADVVNMLAAFGTGEAAKRDQTKKMTLSVRLWRKGLGEIGLMGVAAAIRDAVYSATGKRIRELPITLDKLI